MPSSEFKVFLRGLDNEVLTAADCGRTAEIAVGNLQSNPDAYINTFSANVPTIKAMFKFGPEIAFMTRKKLLFEIVKVLPGQKPSKSGQRHDGLPVRANESALLPLYIESALKKRVIYRTPLIAVPVGGKIDVRL